MTQTTLKLTVLSPDSEIETQWARELDHAIAQLGITGGLRVECGYAGGEPGQIVFFDCRFEDLNAEIRKIGRGGRAIFVVARDGADDASGVSEAIRSGDADDILVHPFRALEVLGKIQHYQRVLLWDEVSRVNTSFSELLERLHDDLKLAERLQKGKLPVRFPEIKGFKIANRYFAGMKSGGDHFDLAESKDAQSLSMVLTDSSSYGLSSSVLAILMKVAMKLSPAEARSCSETVRRIQEELLLTLNEKDRLSLFYGTLLRKDYRLRYLNLGSGAGYYAKPGGKFAELSSQGAALSRASGDLPSGEGEIVLEPGGRLILVSDGFVESTGGKKDLVRLLDQLREKEPTDVLNELTFRMKSQFTEPDDLPAQDCTAAVFDVDPKLIRLA